MTLEELIERSDKRSILKPSIHDIATIYHEGLVEGLPFNAYAALPGLNPSTIASGKKSMRHARKSYEEGWHETYAMVLGRYGHTLVLEPDRLEEDWIVVQGDRRGNKWKDACAQARAERKNVICTDGKDGADQMHKIVDEALQFRGDDLRAIIGHGVSELSMLLPWQGVQCKGRCDWLNTDSSILVDLKFQYSVAPRSIINSSSDFLYHVKLATYRAWLERLTGKQIKKVCLVFISTKGVVDVAIRWVPEWLLEDGLAQAAKISGQIAEELNHNHWYGYDDGKTNLELEVKQWELLEEQEETIY